MRLFHDPPLPSPIGQAGMSRENYAGFFWEFVRDRRAGGAVAPSSQRLARHTVNAIDWSRVQRLVDYGPGTGAITEAIMERKPPQVDFFGIELNTRFVAELKERFTGMTVFNDSVANVGQLATSLGWPHVDAVISGLPWSSFTEGQQDEYLDAMQRALSPHGQFATYAYLTGLPLPAAKRFRAKLHQYFPHVKRTRTIWRNVPPAFVYYCSK